MKKISILKISLIVLAFASLLTSCLKDKAVDSGRIGVNVNNGQRLVEIAGPLDDFINIDLIGSDVDTTVNVVMVRLASQYPADNDITVTLVADPALVDAYNTEHGTNYEVPDASLYNLPSLTVTIPKGSRVGYLSLKATPNDLFGSDYALGFRIASVSDPSITISGNFKEQVVGLTIRNKYDGTYTMTGTLVDAAVPALTAKSPTEVQLITSGSNSVYLWNSGAGNPGFVGIFPIMNGASESAYGSFTPEFIFDANNNVVAVVNAYGQPAGNTRSAAIDPSGENKWDPATRTLKVKWFMYQPSVIAGVRTTFNYTFTYQGPR